ncbi:hypothetical protein R9C00_08510 [Flammeovirgaceae bacterium SG7u.111]|nr:hypothetical protein [Flammeovirgaceae bacterium SG7u.132]WPO37489.1 hypothetical protein R9C00_08510 [Flammeovirgaceae bacterium SG7u.111]
MELTKNKFVKASYEESKSLLTVTWLPETANMTGDDYKDVINLILDFFKEYTIKNWLGDTKKFAFPIVPELQEWFAHEINPQLIKLGLQRIAMVVPEDLIAQLAVDQALDEMDENKSEGKVISKYFDNLEDAKKWATANE